MNAVRRLGEAVFVPEGPARLARRDVAVGVVGLVVLALIVGVRASSVAITTTMWAEDGRIFLAEAVNHGVLQSLFRGYAGYSHFVPRLIAAVVAAVDTERAALVMAMLACGTAAGLALFIARASAGHIRSRLGRFAYATLVVALPIAGVEVLGNIANLHWILLVAAFWALVWRPSDRRNVVLACVVVALATLSDPLTALLAPLALWRVVTVTSWRDRAVAATFAAGVAVQALVVLTTQGMPITREFRRAVRLFEQRVVVGSLLGVRGTPRFFDEFGVRGVDVLFAVLAIVAVVLWWRYGGDARVFLATCAIASFGLFVLSVGLRAGADPRLISGVVAGGGRYTVAPALIAAGAVIALFERVDWRAAAVVAAAGAAVCAVDFRAATLRGGDITWARGIAIAQTSCRHGVDPTSIPILPVVETRDWYVPVPCSYVSP